MANKNKNIGKDHLRMVQPGEGAPQMTARENFDSLKAMDLAGLTVQISRAFDPSACYNIIKQYEDFTDTTISNELIDNLLEMMRDTYVNIQNRIKDVEYEDFENAEDVIDIFEGIFISDCRGLLREEMAAQAMIYNAVSGYAQKWINACVLIQAEKIGLGQ